MFGAGAGLVASQLGNVIMSSVGEAQTNEAGGLQGTAQNLGALARDGAHRGDPADGPDQRVHRSNVAENQALPAEVRASGGHGRGRSGLQVVTIDQATQVALDAGLTADQAAALTADYQLALLEGLRNALGAVAVVATLGLWFTRRLPSGAGVAAADPSPVPAPA